MEPRSRSRHSWIKARYVALAFAILLLLVIARMFWHEHATQRIRDAGGHVQTYAQALPAWLRRVPMGSYLRPMFSSKETFVQFTGADTTNSRFATVRGLPRIDSLELHSTEVTGEGLRPLAHHTEIRKLFLNYNPIGNDGLVHIAGLTQLEWLELSGTRFEGAGLMHLTELRDLRRLGLIGTAIDDSSMPALAPMSRLEELDLSGTRVSDAGLRHLSGLTNLRQLGLVDTLVTPDGARQLQRLLPQCRIELNLNAATIGEQPP